MAQTFGKKQFTPTTPAMLGPDFKAKQSLGKKHKHPLLVPQVKRANYARPGSSDRYVKFLPLGEFFGEQAQILHTWKIQGFHSQFSCIPSCIRTMYRSDEISCENSRDGSMPMYLGRSIAENCYMKKGHGQNMGV